MGSRDRARNTCTAHHRIPKFSAVRRSQFGAAPNTQACPVDLALPGVLPVINTRAPLRRAIQFGLADWRDDRA